MSETPQVTQSKLNVAHNEVRDVHPDELTPHPKNQEIYGDNEDVDGLNDEFVESIKQKGVLEPLTVTSDGKIISGHRRWVAAQEVNLSTVPVRKESFDSDLEIREALIEFNRQREKTPGQIVNEFEEMLAVERERAKERKSHGETAPGKNASGNVSNSVDTGAARDKAAEKVNADVSGRTLEKGRKVKEKATDKDAPDEVKETAQREWEKLQEGKTSFHTASKNVEKAEAEKKAEEQRNTDDETSPPALEKTDAQSLLRESNQVDMLLTDPPYTTDVDDIEAFAESWVPQAVELIDPSGVGFICIGAYSDELQAYLNVLDECGVRDRTDVLVWTYKNTLGQTPNDQYKRNWQAILFIQSKPSTEIDSPLTSEQWGVQEINAPDGRHDGRYHKWEKPKELFDRFIRHTTDEGDTVIDPFVGTGTTALVANELNREVIAGDKSSDMLEIAAKRGCDINE